MELYSSVAYKSSRLLTLAYSTSFGISSYFFPKKMRTHIYGIYGMVRIADEIVDTYKGVDAAHLLEQLEQDVYKSITRGYDTNPIIHAFAETARQYSITQELISPFFKSMSIDLEPQRYDDTLYREYIHGSAEVVGLMCLRVFCEGDEKQYSQLKGGAMALGSAYQKVNFLRDMAEDYADLGRVYFPGAQFETFNDQDKQAIIKDIEKDFRKAHASLLKLPKSSRIATMTSYAYYTRLLHKLEHTPAVQIKQQRVRVPVIHKILLLLTVLFAEMWKK